MRRNNVVDAIASFKSAIGIDPGHVISLVNLGAAMGNMNDFRGAVMALAIFEPIAVFIITQVQYYEQALAVDPTFTAARHNLASAYHSLKLNDKAIALFEQIVQDQPLNFEATISLAHVYGRRCASRCVFL